MRARSTPSSRASAPACTPQEARGVPPGSRERSAREGPRRRAGGGREASQALTRAVCRPARDRRAEDLDSDQRRVHLEREHSADHRTGCDGGGGAHQPVRAQARLRNCSTSPTRGRRSNAVRRSPGAGRGARDARRRVARCAVHRHRHRAKRCSTASTSELSGYYLLGVESDGRDKDGKPHPIRIDVPRKGAVVRSRRQLVNAASDRPTPNSPRAAAARGAHLAADRRARCRCASLRSRCRGRSATRCSCCSTPTSAPTTPASKVVSRRLRHHQRRGAGGRQQVSRHAAAAGDERRPVAAAVHRRREPRARRLHAEARRRRRRSRRQRRASDPRCAARRQRAHAQRVDGRRPAGSRRAADADDRLPDQLRLGPRLPRGLRREDATG